MAVPHLRTTILGTISSGMDTWSTSFSSAPPAAPTVALLEACASSTESLFDSNVWTGKGSRWPSTTLLTGARCQMVDAAGHVTMTGEFMLGTAVPGTATGVALPPECAIVVSLRTSTAGPRGRGRMYLPGCAVNHLMSGGQLNAGVVGDVADGMKAFFDAWNLLTFPFPVGVASGTGGFVTTVTNIKVGTVVDAQRRRRNRIPEAYISRVIV